MSVGGHVRYSSVVKCSVLFMWESFFFQNTLLDFAHIITCPNNGFTCVRRIILGFNNTSHFFFEEEEGRGRKTVFGIQKEAREEERLPDSKKVVWCRHK